MISHISLLQVRKNKNQMKSIKILILEYRLLKIRLITPAKKILYWFMTIARDQVLIKIKYNCKENKRLKNLRFLITYNKIEMSIII
jgi:hypothetical protein